MFDRVLNTPPGLTTVIYEKLLLTLVHIQYISPSCVDVSYEIQFTKIYIRTKIYVKIAKLKITHKFALQVFDIFIVFDICRVIF